MDNSFILDIIAKLNKQLSKTAINNDLKTLNNTIYVKVLAKISKTLATRELKKQLRELNDLYVNVGTKVKTGKATKTQIQKNIKELQQTISDLEIGLKATKINKDIDSVRNRVQKKVQSTPISYNVEIGKSKLIADIEYLGKRYSKLFSNVSASNKYENILSHAYNASDQKHIADTKAELAAFTSELKANGLAAQSTKDKWGKLIDRAKELFSAASIIRTIFVQVKQSVSTFLELDTAMTNLYKVQEGISSRDQFSGLLTKWNKLAQELAVTTTSLINSAAEWSKMGFDLDMSEQLAQITAIFEKTAEITNEKASSTLISAAQAFTEIDDLGVDDYVKRVEAVGNKINAIGNRYAISSEGIADGLQNASAALKMAGNDLNETISLITATNKIYQSPEEGSNMLKVASMRLRGQIDALKELGEDAEGVSTDITKIQQQIYELTGNKVNIFEDDENLKSTYQMILEIGEVFDKLGDRQQAELLEVIFGKQRASAGASLLLNYQELEAIKNDSMNAANSMAEEYSKYMESAEAHITIFKEKLTETYSTFMSGDLIKYTSDVGIALLDLVNSTDLLKHSLIAITALKVGQGISSLGAVITSTVTQMNTLGNAIQQVKNLPLDDVLRTEPLVKIGKATKDLTEKNLKLLLSQKGLEYSDKILILEQHKLTEEEAIAKLEKIGLTDATNKNTAANIANAASANASKGAFTGLAASIKATWSAMSLLQKASIIFAAVSTAWSVYSMIVDNYNQKVEESRRKAIELTNAYKEQQSSLEAQTKKYRELKESLDKGNLSTDETRSIKKQLLEVQQSLIDSYGNEASNLDLVNGLYKEQLGLLSELSKDKATEYIRKHKDMFDEAIEALEKTRTYDLGTIATWSSLYPKTEEQQKLLDFIESYSELLKLNEETKSSRGASFTSVNLSVEANIEDAEKVINDFLDDLDQYSKENNLDIDALELLDGTSKQLREMWSDELTEYKSIRDEYVKAQITENDTLRPLYQQSISAVEAYNKALSSGEGIKEAKANLDSLQLSVQEVTGELEGSQEIFDGIYEGINKSTEAAYNLNQAFENDDTVKEYAEQLRGLYDKDLEAINFDNNNIELGEEAFRGLIDALGLTEEQTQKVIDKLVELGYVQGKTVDSGTADEPPTFFTQLNNSKDSLDKFQSSVKSAYDVYSTLLSDNYSSSELLDSLQAINQAVTDMGETIDWEFIDADSSSLKLLGDEIERISQEYAESVLSGAGIDVDSKFGQMLANNIIQAQKASTQLEVLNDQINSLQSAYNDLTDIVETYNETGYITFDQLQKLLEMEPQYLSCLIDENGQLQLNEQAMVALANKRLDDAAAQAIQQAITELGTLTLQDEKVAVEQNAEAFSDAVNDLAVYNEELANTIAEASVGAAVIRDLNAAISGAETAGATDDQINTVLNNLEAKLQMIGNVREKVNSGGLGSVMGSATKAAAKSLTDALDKELAELDKRMEAGYIDFNDYIQARLALIEDYYRQGKISADEYYSYLEKHYNKQLEIYNKVLNAVKRRYDKEIDSIKNIIDGIEKQNDALEKQLGQYDSVLKVIDKVYADQIDALKDQQNAIDDQIDALKSANDEKRKALELDKAKYELAKAQSLRTRLVYSEEKGMHYETDTDAIRSAREKLEDATLEDVIFQLEKEKNAIDPLIEELERYREKWAEIAKAYQDAIDKNIAEKILGPDYENAILQNRIEDIESFKSRYVEVQKQIDNNQGLIDSYNEKIEYYEALKQQWQDITGAYENSIEDQLAAMILGQNWELDVLTGRLDTLNVFKNQYAAIQQSIVDMAWWSANEQIKASQEAEKGASGTPSSAPTISNNSNVTSLPTNKTSVGRGGGKVKAEVYALQDTYASGTNNAKKGLNLVGEDGAEAYFDNHDHVAIVTEPTLIPMEGGEVVKNAQDTKKLLNSDNLKPVDNIALGDIDGKEAEYTIKVNIETEGEIPDVKSTSLAKNDGSFTLANGDVLRPLREGDPGWDIVQKANAYFAKVGGDISSFMTPINSMQKDMERLANAVNTVNNINNSRTQQVNIGDIHITCPGVTDKEVMQQIGVALDRKFNGLHLDAMQESKKR